MFGKVLAPLIIGATLAVSPATASYSAPLDTTGTYPEFNNPGDASLGADAIAGDTVDYDSVLTVGGTTVDARITVISVDGTVYYLDDIDDQTASPWPQIFSVLSFQDDADGGGSVRYRIDFFDHDTDEPIELSGLSATVKDIDENQYFQANHIAQYRLSATPVTALTVLTHSDESAIPRGEFRFASPSMGISPTDEDYWASVTFDATSSITVELGQGDFDQFEGAWYFVGFAPTEWTVDPVETDSSEGNNADNGSANNSDSAELAATGAPYEPSTFAGFAALAIAIGLLARRARRAN